MIAVDISVRNKEQLESVLRQYYAGIRTKNGETYSRSSYLAARAATQRKFRSFNRSFNIFTDPIFRGSVIVLDGILKKNKAEGKSKQTQHKATVTEADVERLKRYFADTLTANNTSCSLSAGLQLRYISLFVEAKRCAS